MGDWISRHRSLTIALWSFLMALSLAVTPALHNALQETGAVYEQGEAYRTQQHLQTELKIDSNPLILVVQPLAVQPPVVQPPVVQPLSTAQSSFSQIELILRHIRALPAVESIDSATLPQRRQAGAQYHLIHLQSNQEVNSTISQIEQILAVETPEALRILLTGQAVVDREVQQISRADLSRIELYVLPLTLILLLVIFGSFFAAAIPVLMGAMTVSITSGILYLVTLKFSVSIFALNLASMLGLGLGIDYSLFIISRFREELQSQSVKQAIAQTLATAGQAIFFSGLTVCIGLICLMQFPISLLQSLSLAGAIVVLLSVLAALTLLPALLSFIGQRLQKAGSQPPFASQPETELQAETESQPGTESQAETESQPRTELQQPGIWAAIARKITRHSLVAFVLVIAIVAGLTAPFLSAQFGLPNTDILPLTSPARAGIEAIQRSFGAGETTPISIEVQTTNPNDSILTDPYLTRLYNLVTQLQQDARIANVTSVVNLNPQLTLTDYRQLYRQPESIPDPQLKAAVQQLSRRSLTLISVKSRTTNDATSRRLVQDLRALKLEGLQLQVAGQSANELDTIEAIYARFPWVLLAMTIATYILLCSLLRSIILPLKAIVMNMLSIGASFGALVFIFQQGHFQNLFNFTPVGYLDILLPVVLFYVLFGVSMDYEVFLLSRIKEAYDDTQDNSHSIMVGLEQTGGIITSAALVLIIVTGAFAFASIIFVKALGLGSAIAILIDATLIRVVLVPATMQLLNRWNWWFFR